MTEMIAKGGHYTYLLVLRPAYWSNVTVQSATPYLGFRVFRRAREVVSCPGP